MYQQLANGPWNLVNVPGWGGSSDWHWQTRWEREFPRMSRVEQIDWMRPDRALWVDRLSEQLERTADPVVLVGHSLGVATIVHAAAEGRLGRVVGAFLVAMPDVQREDFPSEIVGFAPLPKLRLPFPSLMIGSQNDPYIDSATLAAWASRFGAPYLDLGLRHHIGDAAGLGDWEEGKGLLEGFLEGLAPDRKA